MSQEALSERDLRNACLHEYAHEAVARHYGFHMCQVEIRPNESGNTAEKLWRGRFGFHPIRMAMYRGKPHPVPLRGAEHRRAMASIGLAGHVASMFASHCEEGGDPRDIEWFGADELLEYIDLGEPLSSTDAAIAGKYTRRDLERAVALVRRYWLDIVRATVEHIESETGGRPAVQASQ